MRQTAKKNQQQQRQRERIDNDTFPISLDDGDVDAIKLYVNPYKSPLHVFIGIKFSCNKSRYCSVRGKHNKNIQQSDQHLPTGLLLQLRL